MIRNGMFCLFNNVEYQFNRDTQGNILIITGDTTKIDSSFVDKYGSGVYSKKVSVDQITEIYKVNTIGKVGDLKVNVEKELEDSFVVGTSELKIAQQLGLKRCDKYYHRGIILKKDISVSEEKVQIK